MTTEIHSKTTPVGVVAAFMSAQNLLRAGASPKIVLGPNNVQPETFWAKLPEKRNRLSNVIVLGRGVPPFGATRDNAEKAVETLVGRGVGFEYCTFFRQRANDYGALIAKGGIVSASSRGPQYAFWGDPRKELDPFIQLMATMSWQPDADLSMRARERAQGFKHLVRTDPALALAELQSGNLDFQGVTPEIPDNLRWIGSGKSLVFFEGLDNEEPIDQLLEACLQFDVPYAAGVTSDGKKAIAVRHPMKREHLPVPFFLGLCAVDEPGAYVSSEGAIVFRASATERIGRLLERLSNPLWTELLEPGFERNAKFQEFVENEAQIVKRFGGRVYEFVHYLLKLVEMPEALTDHAATHNFRVLAAAITLGGMFHRPDHKSLGKISKEDLILLDLASTLHDVGHYHPTKNSWEARGEHHEIAPELILRWVENGLLTGYSKREVRRIATKVADLSKHHRHRAGFPADRSLHYLCKILRIADGSDADRRRAEFNSNGTHFSKVLKRLKQHLEPSRFQHEHAHIMSHIAVESLRFIAAPSSLEVLVMTSDPSEAAFQAARLRQELEPLKAEDYSVSVRVVKI